MESELYLRIAVEMKGHVIPYIFATSVRNMSQDWHAVERELFAESVSNIQQRQIVAKNKM